MSLRQSARSILGAVLALVPIVARAADPTSGRLVLVGDADGDLTSEVAWIHGRVLELRGGPALEEVRYVLSVSDDAVVAMVGDVDGDGLADFAIGLGAKRTVDVVLGRGAVLTLGDDDATGFGAAVTGADLDGDGRSELVVGAPDRGTVFVYRADGDGIERVAERLGLGRFGREVQRAFDVDGDGRGDLLVADDDGMWVLGDVDIARVIDLVADGAALGDTDGDGRANVVWPDGGEARGVGDVNGDFVADVLIDTPDGSRLVLGAAHGQPRLDVWSGPRAFALGDIDGDGLADIGWAGGERLSIRHGAMGTLGPVAVVVQPEHDPTPPAAPTLPRIALFGGPDLDGDGRRGDLLMGLPYHDAKHAFLGTRLVDSGDFGRVAASDDAFGAAATVAPMLAPSLVGQGAVGAAIAVESVRGEIVFVVAGPQLARRNPFFFDAAGWPLGNWPDSSPEADGGGALFVCDRFVVAGDRPSYLGPQSNARFGEQLISVGDLDGDGVVEFAVAAPGYSPDVAHTEAGMVLVLRRTQIGDLDEDHRIPSWLIIGTRPGEALGQLAALGDVDGDALADFAIGSPGVGEVQVVFGGLFADAILVPPPKNRVHVIDGPKGVAFGRAVTGGDFDGDGFADVAIAAPGAARIDIFRGPELAVAQRLEVTATRLATCDFDGDGQDELVVADSDGGDAGGGRVQVFGGGAAGLSTTPLWTAEGARPGAEFGLALATFDRNHDGLCDLAIGLLDAEAQPLVAVYLGNDGARAATPAATTRDGFEVADVDPWGRVGPRDLVIVRVTEGSPFPGPRRVRVEVTGAATRAPAVGAIAEATGPSGEAIEVTVRGLTPATPYRWRMQVRFDPAQAPLQPGARVIAAYAGETGRVTFRSHPNAAPIARDDRFHLGQAEARIPIDWLLDNDYDVDLDALEIEIVEGPTGGTLSRADDALVYRSDDGVARADGFAYQARDRFGARSAIATVSLVVTPCEIDACRDGVIAGDLALPAGARAGFTCRVRYDTSPPTIDCPTDGRGRLVLGSPSCGP